MPRWTAAQYFLVSGRLLLLLSLLLLLLLLLLFPIYLQNLLLPCFFYVPYLSWLSEEILTKISKCK